LGSPPALANPEGQTSITGTARFVPTTFYIASLPFQDTHQKRRISHVKRHTVQITTRDGGMVAPHRRSSIICACMNPWGGDAQGADLPIRRLGTALGGAFCLQSRCGL